MPFGKYVTDLGMKKELVPRSLLEQAAHRFRLMGEPARLEILNLLQARGESNVQDLVESTGRSQANVSKHLGLMLSEGMVRRRQEGPFAFYSISDPTLAAICMLVCGKLQQEAQTNEDSSLENADG